MPTLYAAFKGNGNSANKIVRGLDGDKLFLTNKSRFVLNIFSIAKPVMQCAKRLRLSADRGAVSQGRPFKNVGAWRGSIEPGVHYVFIRAGAHLP